MKPPPFDWVAPADLEEALAALAADPDDARPLAGGQSLVPMLNFRLAAPGLLVDLNRIAELSGIEERDGGLSIGAMTRQRELERDPRVAARAPLLAETAPWIAHPQIRNRGTIGGSVAHADPAAEIPAVLLVLGARARLVRAADQGVDGCLEESGGVEAVAGSSARRRSAPRLEREIPLADFFLGPFFTVLEPGELLVGLDVPGPAEGEGTAFEEVARRRGDYAIVGAAARIRLDEDGACAEAALALVNAGPAPALSEAVAEMLAGREVTPDAIGAAAGAAADEAEPTADMHASEEYRRHLVRILAARTLGRAAERARAASRVDSSEGTAE